MNSEAAPLHARFASNSLPARLFGIACLVWTSSTLADEPTWKTVENLTAEERALYDPDTTAPRDSTLPYIPAEPYPFTAPFTAEEMGYRASEFVHISRWPYSLVDVFGVITSSGYINQGVGVSYIMQTTEPGLEGYIKGLNAGEVHGRWLIYSTFPPETEAEQQLWVIYRSDAKFTTKMDFFVYSPQLRRVRRQPQPRRDQRFPDNAQTVDDVIGRDPWELQWSLLGTDVIRETVRYPNTRPTITFNDPKQGFVEVKTAGIKPMGDDYPYYGPDGGIDCWVVKATVREDLVPGYNEKTLIFWLDKHYFYPLRTEKYNHAGELIMIEVRNSKHENPALGDFGYSAHTTVYWDLEHDVMSYSVHDAHEPHPWTAEQQAMIFTPEFMRRQWLYEPLKSQALIHQPDQYFMRPLLYRDKFPDVRKIVMSAELEARVQAQDQAGHLVFDSTGGDAGSGTKQ